MDPNPKTFPILSYVMARLPSFGPNPATTDMEAPVPVPSTSQPPPILSQLPHLTDPKLLASMARAVSDVVQTRDVLRSLGPRPAHEAVDTARLKLSEIEARERMDEEAKVKDEEAEKEKGIYKLVIQLEEMHADYERLLKEAEARLVSIYEKETGRGEEEGEGEEVEEFNEEVIGILEEASRGEGFERLDLDNRRLRLLPEAFGRILGLRVLNVSSNQLEMIPDSISGLESLEELNLASNLLKSLPDSIGCLQNLKILDVSGNKLEALPDTICHCRSLVELDVSFNGLTYLPTNLGYELLNVRRLCIQLNKIRSLPTSICQMRSLQHLDAHFNEINGLPLAMGWLKNLEYLNLSSNFNDLTELPETFGELTNLKELDLSNNQISVLPDTFGRLDNLIKLNLDQNPIVIPPVEVVERGVEAVKNFMAKRWLDLLIEEERKSILEEEEQQQTQTGFLARSTTWMKNYVSGVTTNVSGYFPRTPQDPYLDQQL